MTTKTEQPSADSFDPSHTDAFHFWADWQVVAEIERLQAIQKRNPVVSASWGEASSKLQPLFAEMARRHPVQSSGDPR